MPERAMANAIGTKAIALSREGRPLLSLVLLAVGLFAVWGLSVGPIMVYAGATKNLLDNDVPWGLAGVILGVILAPVFGMGWAGTVAAARSRRFRRAIQPKLVVLDILHGEGRLDRDAYTACRTLGAQLQSGTLPALATWRAGLALSVAGFGPVASGCMVAYGAAFAAHRPILKPDVLYLGFGVLALGAIAGVVLLIAGVPLYIKGRRAAREAFGQFWMTYEAALASSHAAAPAAKASRRQAASKAVDATLRAS